MTRRLVAATLSLALAGGASAALASALDDRASSDRAYQFCVGLTKKGGGMDNVCVDVGGDDSTTQL